MKPIEKQIARCLEDLSHEISVYEEVSGIKGKSEQKFAFYCPFPSGMINEKARELLREAKRIVVAKGAIPETLRWLQNALVEAKTGRPQVDKTHSQEEEDRRIAERRAEEEARLKGNAQKAEAGNRMRAKAPKWAKAAIVAELHVDESDSMTDYASSRIEKRMLIGWRSGKRDDFQQMRLAAATQPETAHLNDRTYEHREKYSMGHGFYLAVSRYEGWHVRAQSLSALDHYDFEDRVPELARPVEFEGILVRENDPRDGIEILFPWFPKAEVRDALKANGFRWSRAQKLWYARRTEATRQFAQALAERPEAEVRHEEAAG